MNRPLAEKLIGTKAIVTTDDWFWAPDGENYKAVFGTLRAVHSDEATLGIRTNARSTNWYLEVGNMLIAGCQIHYIVRSNTCSGKPPVAELDHEGRRTESQCAISRIYMADDEEDLP